MTDEPKTESPTWPIVLEFAKRMEMKLEKNRHKGGPENWRAQDCWSLLVRVKEEVNELQAALNAKTVSAEAVMMECADIANFAMMIEDWYAYRVKHARILADIDGTP